MRIGLVTGFWSTNIGNAFFHLGAHTLLSALANESDEIIWLNNMPAYWRLFNKSNPKNAVRGIGEPDLDVLVMVGPFLRKAFPGIWAEEVARLKAAGTKIVMIGLGAMQHDQETRELCREWFKKYRPDFIASRDQATFETLDGLGLNIEPVVCPAFFVSAAVQKPTGSVKPYVVVNCEKISEPKISSIQQDSLTEGGTVISVEDKQILLTPSAISKNTYLERFAELTMNIRAMFSTPNLASIENIPIYRTIHRSNPFVLRNLFPQPNTMVSDVPHPYLLAYANAKYIITDRVHTAVAGISYGTPVAFVGRTKRQGLLLAGGATIHDDGKVTVDYDVLATKKARLKELVSTHVFNRPTPANIEGAV